MGLVKLTDTSVSLFFEGFPAQANTYPFCMLDQYLATDVSKCEQCPLGAYGLST